ncbi:MAG: hypothetical protein ACP5G7_09390 [Anaerolineae bacterium]
MDIGTTSVVTYLGDLATRELVGNASAYNGQIACGDDIISRIIYAKEPARQRELQERVLATINGLEADRRQRLGDWAIMTEDAPPVPQPPDDPVPTPPDAALPERR